MNRKAFTLIELLVVIAIIAILAAILFPVFAQAKVAAKKSASVSNAKQMGLAQFMYMGDSDDTFVTSWAQGFPGDAAFWVQPYMKNLGILMEPNKTVSTSSVATVCANDGFMGSFDMKAGGRDNPTGEQNVWGYGINKGAAWMDGTGVQNQSVVPANKGQVIQGSIGGKTVDVTVWTTHIGRSATSVASPADTFFFSNSGDLPRMSMEILAMLPLNAPGAPTNSACFNAAHAGLPYAGGFTYLFCDGHVKWETYVKTPVGSKATTVPGVPAEADLVGRAQISKNPCRYNADHDPSENFGGCQTGWN